MPWQRKFFAMKKDNGLFIRFSRTQCASVERSVIWLIEFRIWERNSVQIHFQPAQLSADFRWNWFRRQDQTKSVRSNEVINLIRDVLHPTKSLRFFFYCSFCSLFSLSPKRLPIKFVIIFKQLLTLLYLTGKITHTNTHRLYSARVFLCVEIGMTIRKQFHWSISFGNGLKWNVCHPFCLHFSLPTFFLVNSNFPLYIFSSSWIVWFLIFCIWAGPIVECFYLQIEIDELKKF